MGANVVPNSNQTVDVLPGVALDVTANIHDCPIWDLTDALWDEADITWDSCSIFSAKNISTDINITVTKDAISLVTAMDKDDVAPNKFSVNNVITPLGQAMDANNIPSEKFTDSKKTQRYYQTKFNIVADKFDETEYFFGEAGSAWLAS